MSNTSVTPYERWGAQDLALCTGGSGPICKNPVSPDDPDNELCRECLEKRIAELETIITDAIKERVKYRMAVK